MRALYVIIALAVIGAMLAGCGGGASSSATAESGSVPIATAGVYSSAVLVTGYENALPANSQLALGTLRLEGTKDAVTPAQAKALLPLWQAVQAGVLQNDAETSAVLKQIEGTMTAEQLAAIAAMQLTTEDIVAYAQESGLQGPGAAPGTMGPPPGAGAMATPPAGGAQGGPGGFGNLSEEERAAMRATAEAGGFGPGSSSGGQGFGNMSDEQRAAMRATAEAGGMAFPGRSGTTGQGQLTMLAARLVDLLTQRAAA